MNAILPARATSPDAHQRAKGALHIGFVRRDTVTALARLRQEGCLKARFPRPERGAFPCGVLINSSGGIAAGDALGTVVEVGPQGGATIATQAAERVYRALPGATPARLSATVRLGEAATLEWLPQETILFNQAALDRTLSIDCPASATFIGVETLVFGRALMGEEVEEARLIDRIRLTRAGRLVLHDAVRLQGTVRARLARPAVAGGGRAIATMIYAAPDAAERLPALREALDGAASCWDGLLVARIVAADMAAARRAVLAGLAVLRAGRPVPRVWQS